MEYPHFGLTEWPFQVVPSPGFYRIMADRERTKTDVEAVLRNLSRRPNSSAHILWAWYGAGKTHTLRHICYLCSCEHANMLPVYCEFPRSAKSFVDVYRSFAAAIDLDRICDSYLEVVTSPVRDTFRKRLQDEVPDLYNALQLIAMGEENGRSLGVRWLRAENLPVSELRRVGIHKRIELPEDAVRALTWLVSVVVGAAEVRGESSRVLWMIDEYQRVEACRPSVVESINSCVHSVFNHNPVGFSLFLSFSGRPQRELPGWLSEELRDRIGIERPILLPPMSKDEGIVFVRELLSEFRPANNAPPGEYFPFEEEAVEHIVAAIETRNELKPRSIMQFFQAVLEEADPLMQQGCMKSIDAAFAEACLKDISQINEQ